MHAARINTEFIDTIIILMIVYCYLTNNKLNLFKQVLLCVILYLYTDISCTEISCNVKISGIVISKY